MCVFYFERNESYGTRAGVDAANNVTAPIGGHVEQINHSASALTGLIFRQTKHT